MDTVESLCQRYQVDLAHARHVSALALGLFDGLQPVHDLPPRSRDLLDAGALLHNVGVTVDVPNHHLAGRDILVASSLQGFDPAERIMLACLVAFHRKRVQPQNESLFEALNTLQQHQTLVLSALIRIADGLDSSQSQTTEIEEIEEMRDWRLGIEPLSQSPISNPQSPNPAQYAEPRIPIHVCGPYSHEDAARAAKKADLWNTLFPPMHITARMTRPGIILDDAVARAGRRILRYQMEMLAPEDWRLSDGVTPKGIHQLRVTVRRLRSTLRVFKPYYKSRTVQPIAKGLRDLAGTLAPVRELDVAVRALKRFHQACDEETRRALQPLLDTWRAQRKATREDARRYLQDESHAAWLEDMTRFVQSNAYDRALEHGQPYHLRHVVDEILASHIADVRAYDTLPVSPAPEDLHALRIAVKRLRYLTDVLREVLPGPRVEQIITVCAAAQDEYGMLHDAHLVAERALSFMAGLRTGAEPRASDEPPIAHSVLSFAESQQRAAEQGIARWKLSLTPLLVL
ncbi:MAG: CHAD domain-containing protein [Chloroflexi bacterium]|nr:CHAD domain-containing protein [Chloroflexota bacterium]